MSRRFYFTNCLEKVYTLMLRSSLNVWSQKLSGGRPDNQFEKLAGNQILWQLPETMKLSS